MNRTRPPRRGVMTRDATGSGSAEAFVLIAIATILLTRLYLELTGYPQVGGGDLHIAHALWGGTLMMFALVTGWLLIGAGARVAAVVMGGVGFGLFLDEVGKFVTKSNDYFYGPAAEIIYILVVLLLVGARVFRDFRPLTARESLASAAVIAADGVARGVADRRRQLGLALLVQAEEAGAAPSAVGPVRTLLLSAETSSDRLYRLQQWAPRLIPGFFRSPRWVPVVGWLLVVSAISGLFSGLLGIALGGYFYQDDDVTLRLDGMTPASVILVVNAAVTSAIALPAMIARRRTTRLWPLRWLRNAALLFTFLNAFVDFATEGFAALISMSIGLFTLAVLTYQIDVQVRRTAGEVSERPQVAPGDPALQY